ncbi:paraquat-inducible protein a [Sulfurovum lithotrophicum]|uniref:Paraquat-inducible protein a n=1 Tax=Sulfurovum lithotrophicum TaxID=206403 RepID=A0A7U4RRB6_9BACT|nr:paraquat-inducible protein A [Sulfurovum lithotrophicum]AKF25738.1 paraquat-inducible protein a [Sulfurovum lithotrophicum]
MKYIVYMIITVLLSVMVFFGSKAYSEAKAYETTTLSLIDEMSAEKLAKFQLKELAETVSLGFYKNRKKGLLETLKKTQQMHKEQSQKYAMYALLPFLGVLASYFFISLRAFTFFGAVGALIMLAFGLIVPVMMVTIHKEVEYLGDVVLSFESKGVIGSISKLFENGDTVVALVILLFSVLIPLLKTFSMMVVSVFMDTPFVHGIVKFFKMIGKWSMVDVFVVATFLVYLTVNKGDVSRAEVEVGLYFFLAYVIVSMLVSLSADKMLHRQNSVR